MKKLEKICKQRKEYNFTEIRKICLEDEKNRFILAETEKEELKNPLICIGLNPSKADIKKDDQTIRKIRKISENLKCDGWIMLNLYPLRETKPQNLKDKKFNKDISIKNVEIIKDIILEYEASPILLCWGNDAVKKEIFKNPLKEIFKVLELELKRCYILKGEKELSGRDMPFHPRRIKMDNLKGEKITKEILKKISEKIKSL